MTEQYSSQEYTAPKSLFDLLPPMPKKKAKGQGERQNLVNQVCYELGLANHYRSGIFWSTREFKDSEIIALKEEALKFKKNPAALFRILCKKKKQEIKESMV